MTVIAYDHKTKTLAVDSAFTEGERRSYGQKFVECADGRVLMFAGDVRAGRKAMTAIANGEEPTATDIALAAVIVFYRRGRKRGRVEAYEDSNTPDRIKKSNAWGSGADFAVGALAAGVDAEQAVKITCANSASCGGKVHVFRLES